MLTPTLTKIITEIERLQEGCELLEEVTELVAPSALRLHPELETRLAAWFHKSNKSGEPG